MSEIIFRPNTTLFLDSGLCYYENKKIFEITQGLYDLEYFLNLINKCKLENILPKNIICIGIKKDKNNYFLIVI
jgi:hypothetical protein